MNLLKTISDKLNPKPFNRYDIDFFRDKNLQKKMEQYGFAAAPLLENEEIDQLKKAFERLKSMIPEGIGEKFWPSGRTSDPKIRNFAREAIEDIIPKKLRKYVIPEAVDFIGGTFLVKPPTTESRLYPHQDSTHVDEEKFFSVYAWVPLCDVDVFNGTMHVIPGSNHFGNIQRSLNIPWQFHGLEETMIKLVKPVPMKAGDVLFFDSATIHYSPINQSRDVRVAVNYYIKPKACPFMHYYMDEQTPKGKVEVFNVDIDFFYNCDFEKRPPKEYPFLGYVEHKAIRLSNEEFEKMCASYQ